jgi:hypothetical protein
MKFGFVRVPRALLEHPLLQSDHRLSPLEAYLDLLSRANWKPSQVELGGRRLTVEPGQLLCSANSLASRWKWPRTTVQRFLDALHAGRLAGHVSATEATILTLYPDGDMPNSEHTVSRDQPAAKCGDEPAASAAQRADERALLKNASEQIPRISCSDEVSEEVSKTSPPGERKHPPGGKQPPHPLFRTDDFAQFIKETMESPHRPALFKGSLMESLRALYVKRLRDGDVWDAVLESYPELEAMYPVPEERDAE